MLRLLQLHWSGRKLIFYVAEAGLKLSALFLGERLLILWGAIHPLQSLFMQGMILVLFVDLVFYYNDLYKEFVPVLDRGYFVRLLRGFALSGILCFVLSRFFPHLLPPQGLLFVSLVLMIPLVFGWRAAFDRILGRMGVREKILVVGTGRMAQKAAIDLLKRRDLGYKLIGFLDERPERVGIRLVNPSIIGTYSDLNAIVLRENVQRVVVAVPQRRGTLPVTDLLELRVKGVKVIAGEDFYEQISGKVFVEDLHPSDLIFGEGFKKSPLTKLLKRLTGVGISLCILFFTFPLILLIAVLIKLDSNGPIFYRQERVGEGGKPFVLLKFRSMRRGAEEATGPVWAGQADPRVTLVGSILRKTRLDELPQVLNVLKGDMSFVGPRPERPFFVERLGNEIPYYYLRSSLKPGITGWAQIRYSYGASVADAREKLEYDLYYVKNMSLFFDLFIIFETVKVVLFGKGAR